MKIKLKILYFTIILYLLTSCNSKSNENNRDISSTNLYSTVKENSDEETNYRTYENDEETEQTNSGCKFVDGNYSAQ